MKRIILCLYIIISQITFTLGQAAIFCKPTATGDALQLKWFETNFDLTAKYNLYRKESTSESWVKINSSVLECKNNKGATGNDLELYSHFVKTRESKDTSAIALEKHFLLMEIISSNGLAEMMNMYYYDKDVIVGKTYSYQLKRINNNAETLFANSAPVKVEIRKNLTPPTALLSSCKENEIDLSWKTDSSAMMYSIYRSEQADTKKQTLVKTILNPMWDLKSNVLSYYYNDNDSSLQSAHKYFYKVVMHDIFGDQSNYSDVTEVEYFNSKDLQPVTDVKTKVNAGKIELSWRSSASKICKGYNILRANSLTGTYENISKTPLSATTTSFADATVVEGEKYFYLIESVDGKNHKSNSNKIAASIPDKTPPAIPTNLVARPASGTINLSWTKNTEKDLKGYYIFKALKNADGEFNLVNAFPLSGNSYSDTIYKEANNNFIYKICAVDNSWNRSSFSNVVIAKMPDIVPPTRPTLRSLQIVKSTLVVTWSKSGDAFLAGYELMRQNKAEKSSFLKLNTSLISSKDTIFIDSLLESGKSYAYKLVAIDSTGNKSAASNELSLLFTDSKSPITPVDVQLFYSPEKHQNELSWKLINQPKSFGGYIIYRKVKGGDYVPISKSVDTNSFIDTTIDNDLTYYYKVNAIDKNGDLIINSTEIANKRAK